MPGPILARTRGIPPTIGIHNGADEAMTDDIVGRELGEMDVIETLEDVANDAQPAESPSREVDLGDVSGHHHG